MFHDHWVNSMNKWLYIQILLRQDVCCNTESPSWPESHWSLACKGKKYFSCAWETKTKKNIKKTCVCFFLFKMRFQNYLTFFSAFHISCILYKSLSTKSAIILDIKEIWNILLEELPGVSKLVLILARVAHIQLQLCARLKSQDFQLEINIPIILLYIIYYIPKKIAFCRK